MFKKVNLCLGLSEKSLVGVLIVLIVGACVVFTVYTLLMKYWVNRNKEFFQQEKPLFRMFYADWCGHCQSAKPGFLEFKKEVESAGNKVDGKEIEIVMHNADTEKDLISKFDVQGFPTFILSYNGQNYKYEGSRDKAGYLGFIKNMMS